MDEEKKLELASKLLTFLMVMIPIILIIGFSNLLWQSKVLQLLFFISILVEIFWAVIFVVFVKINK